MRPSIALILTAVLATGCARGEKADEETPTFERAQEKLKQTMDEASTRIAEGAAEVREALEEHWKELRPKAERAVASLEERVEKLAKDSEALERLPPEALEQVRARLAALRAKLAEAEAAHEQGNTDLAVERADDVQQETQAIEEMLVERPDPPAPKPE